jgi:hypothetical protein
MCAARRIGEGVDILTGGGDLRGTAKLAARPWRTPLPPLGSLPSPLATNLFEACLSLNSGWCGVVPSRTRKWRGQGQSQVPTLSIGLLCVMYMERVENMHIHLSLLLQISNCAHKQCLTDKHRLAQPMRCDREIQVYLLQFRRKGNANYSQLDILMLCVRKGYNAMKEDPN